jgi:hypothetical protein
MAKRSRMSVLKRQRELKKAEKAAHKRARRHGQPIAMGFEPTPTFLGKQLGGAESETEDSSAPEESEGQLAEDSQPTKDATE